VPQCPIAGDAKASLYSRLRTAFAVIFLLDVSHLAARCASHLARVGVVATVRSTDRRAADTVAVVVALLGTLAASGQSVQRRDALGAEAAALVTARVNHVRREHVARLQVWWCGRVGWCVRCTGVMGGV